MIIHWDDRPSLGPCGHRDVGGGIAGRGQWWGKSTATNWGSLPRGRDPKRAVVTRVFLFCVWNPRVSDGDDMAATAGCEQARWFLGWIGQGIYDNNFQRKTSAWVICDNLMVASHPFELVLVLVVTARDWRFDPQFITNMYPPKHLWTQFLLNSRTILLQNLQKWSRSLPKLPGQEGIRVDGRSWYGSEASDVALIGFSGHNMTHPLGFIRNRVFGCFDQKKSRMFMYVLIWLSGVGLMASFIFGFQGGTTAEIPFTTSAKQVLEVWLQTIIRMSEWDPQWPWRCAIFHANKFTGMCHGIRQQDSVICAQERGPGGCPQR